MFTLVCLFPAARARAKTLKIDLTKHYATRQEAQAAAERATWALDYAIVVGEVVS